MTLEELYNDVNVVFRKIILLSGFLSFISLIPQHLHVMSQPLKLYLLANSWSTVSLLSRKVIGAAVLTEFLLLICSYLEQLTRLLVDQFCSSGVTSKSTPNACINKREQASKPSPRYVYVVSRFARCCIERSTNLIFMKSFQVAPDRCTTVRGSSRASGMGLLIIVTQISNLRGQAFQNESLPPNHLHGSSSFYREIML